jgi:putative addiction module component (TIGR02574 family)
MPRLQQTKRNQRGRGHLKNRASIIKRLRSLEYAHFFDQVRLIRYTLAMITQQLTTEAMALPLSERVMLAQELWQSIDAGLSNTDEQMAVRDAIRRDQELSAGTEVGRTHEEVMQAARRAIGCA